MINTINTPADGYMAIAGIITTHKNNRIESDYSYLDDEDGVDVSPSSAAPLELEVGPACPWAKSLFTPSAARALLRIGAAINGQSPGAILDLFAFELSRCGQPWRAYESAVASYGRTWFCDPRQMLLAAADSADVYSTAAAMYGAE